MSGTSLANSILEAIFENAELLFIVKALRPAPSGCLIEAELTLPLIVGYGIDTINCAGPINPFLTTFLKNLEFLRWREVLPRFNALSFIAPDPVGLRCNTIFRAHGLYAGFLGLFESLKPLFRRMVLFRLDSSGLVAPLPVSLVADVILGADGVYAILFALFNYRELFFLSEARGPTL